MVGQATRGLQLTRSLKVKYILNSVRIKNATTLLDTGAITVKEFLLQCSHCTNNYLDRELNWQEEAQSSEEEPEPFDEQIEVANNPNIEIVVVANVQDDTVEDGDDTDFILPEYREMDICQIFNSIRH